MVEAKEAGFRERAAGLEPLPGLLDFLEGAKARGLRIGLVTILPRPRGRRRGGGCAVDRRGVTNATERCDGVGGIAEPRPPARARRRAHDGPDEDVRRPAGSGVPAATPTPPPASCGRAHSFAALRHIVFSSRRHEAGSLGGWASRVPRIPNPVYRLRGTILPRTRVNRPWADALGSARGRN